MTTRPITRSLKLSGSNHRFLIRLALAALALALLLGSAFNA